MKRRAKFGIIGAMLAVLVAVPTMAMAGGDSETPITGPALEQASAAALDYLGEGTVTDTEIGDEESLYEVEVTLADGTEVDVQLDAQFNIVGSEREKPGESD